MNETPAANQKVPCWGGKDDDSRSIAFSGSDARVLFGSSAAIIGKVAKSLRSFGRMRARLIPAPPPRPVTKNAGGPPMGALTAAKTNSAVNDPVGDGNCP